MVKPELSGLASLRLEPESPVHYLAGYSGSLEVTGVLRDGREFDLTAPELGTVYRSSDSGVVAMEGNRLQAKGVGTATATVTVTNGAVSADLSVTVEPFTDTPTPGPGPTPDPGPDPTPGPTPDPGPLLPGPGPRAEPRNRRQRRMRRGGQRNDVGSRGSVSAAEKSLTLDRGS